MAELTPFPDGIGYMEHVANGLTATQEAVLAHKAGHGEHPHGVKSTTWTLLVGYGLLTGHGYELTTRGRDLVDWLRETGRWPQLTGPVGAPRPADVATAIAWFRENPDGLDFYCDPTAEWHAATIVRAVLAAGPDVARKLARPAGDDTAPKPRTPQAAEAWLRQWVPDSHQEDADAALADLRGRAADTTPDDETDRLRSEVAALRDAGNYLALAAARVRLVNGALRGVDALDDAADTWQSAAEGRT